MRIGVVGLAGAGNTTMAALVSHAYAASGRRVVAIDTDPYPNLGMSLGVDKDEVEATPPVPRGLGSGVGGRLTPAQLVKTYGLETPSGVVVLHAMRAERPGERCSCIGHANPASSLSMVLREEAEVTVIDMEGGLDHLDVVLVTMEPTRKSVFATARSVAIAAGLCARRVLVVGNKARSPEDQGFLTSAAVDRGFRLAAVVPFEMAILEAGRAGAILPAGSPVLQTAIATITEAIDEES